MSLSQDNILALVDQIYTTVETPGHWSEVVRQIAHHSGTPRGLLCTPHHGPEEGGLWHGHDLGMEQLGEYIDYYHQKDVWTQRAHARGIPTRVPVNCDRLVPHTELKKSEFYDYLRRIELEGALGTMLGGEAGTYPRVHLCVYRPPGSDGFEPESEALMEHLIPHVHRALDLGFRFSTLRNRARDELEVLNRLETAVAALHQDGSIAFMNRRAELFLSSGDGLAVRNQRIVADSRQDNEQLWRLIRNTIGRRTKGEPAAGGATTVARVSNRRSYAVTVSPAAGIPDLVGIPSTWALVFIADPERQPEPPIDRIARLYGLTTAEAQVAVSLATGQTLNEYAERSSLSRHTVRSTLKQVFAKTGTHRQVEVVRLILTTPGIEA